MDRHSYGVSHNHQLTAESRATMTAPFDQVVLERADMIRYALKTGFDKYLLSLSAHGERYGAVLVKDLPQPSIRKKDKSNDPIKLDFKHTRCWVTPAPGNDNRYYRLRIIRSEHAPKLWLQTVQESAQPKVDLATLIKGLDDQQSIKEQCEIRGNFTNLRPALGISRHPLNANLSYLWEMCVGPKPAHLAESFVNIAEAGALLNVRMAEASLTTAYWHHEGAARCWIVVPPTQREKFEACIRREFHLDPAKLCNQFIRHLSIWISPKLLTEWNITHYQFEHREEELLVLWPNTYHWGWSSGYSVVEYKYHAESTNHSQDFQTWTARFDPSKYVCCDKNLDLCSEAHEKAGTVFLRIKPVAEGHSSETEPTEPTYSSETDPEPEADTELETSMEHFADHIDIKREIAHHREEETPEASTLPKPRLSEQMEGVTYGTPIVVRLDSAELKREGRVDVPYAYSSYEQDTPASDIYDATPEFEGPTPMTDGPTPEGEVSSPFVKTEPSPPDQTNVGTKRKAPQATAESYLGEWKKPKQASSGYPSAMQILDMCTGLSANRNHNTATVMGEDLFAPGPSSSLAMRNTPNRNSLGPDIFSPSRNANIKQALSPSSADTATAAFRTQSSFPSHSQDTDSDNDDVPADIHPELRRLREELDGARRSKQKYKQKFKEERDEKESIQKEYDEIRKEYNEILHQHNVVSLERDEWKDRYADVRKEVLEEVIRDLLRKRDLPVESQFGDLE